MCENILRYLEESPVGHGEIPGQLHHPALMRVSGNASNMHLLGVMTDEKENIMGDESKRS